MSFELAIPLQSELGSEYDLQRNFGVEFRRATMQHALAGAPISECRKTNWGSFDGGCGVYHGFFPLAELMDMVSSPRHHPELFLDALQNLVKVESPTVWIPASATTRTYDLVRFVKPNANIFQTDICKTPIAALGLAYPKDIQKGILLGGQMDVLKADFMNQFDTIVTDAFLTRFLGDDKKKVLQRFYRALKPGGVLLTTVRIPKSTDTGGGQVRETESEESMSFVSKVVEGYRALLDRTGRPANRPYHSIDELEKAAQAYQATMKSGHEREDADLIACGWMPKLASVPNMGAVNFALMDAGFETSYTRISGDVYDITTRKYLQIAAIK
jgi:SAM-dependent methyltransferase